MYHRSLESEKGDTRVNEPSRTLTIVGKTFNGRLAALTIPVFAVVKGGPQWH